MARPTNTHLRTRHTVLPLTLSLAVLAGCAGAGDDGESDSGEAEQMNPLHRPAQLNETAPDSFDVLFRTTAGDFEVRIRRAQAPIGADRVYNLVTNGYYDGVRFARVVENFMAQFGIHGDPQTNAHWSRATIADDPVNASNIRGTISFAMAGDNTRTTQLFINFVDNSRLDELGFAPLGEVTRGMDTVDQIHSGYGDYAPNGNGPIAQNIAARGNEYLDEEFPELDHIISATVIQTSPAGG